MFVFAQSGAGAGGRMLPRHVSSLRETTGFYGYGETMLNSRFILLSLAMAGSAAAAFAVGRHTRRVEKKQLKEDLRNWEDEGGNLAPPKVPAMTPPAPATVHASDA